MGALFSKPKTPKAPDIPPAEAPPPTAVDQQVVDARTTQRRAGALAAGNANTDLTGGIDLTAGNLLKKKLLTGQ